MIRWKPAIFARNHWRHTFLRRALPTVLGAVALIVGGSAAPGTALAGIVIEHIGANDPTTEGFTSDFINGAGSVGAITGDHGHNAWQINASDATSQWIYLSSLSSTQRSDALSTGWTLSMGAAVVATGSGPESSATAIATFGGIRFDINAFLNSTGNTSVRLDSSLNSNAQSIVHPAGPTYTFSDGAGSYHTYSLVYDPVSHTANLFVDGIEKITGYGGTTEFSSFVGIAFGSDYEGIGRFSEVEFATGPATATPIPSTLVMSSFLIGMFGVVWSCKRLRQTPAST